MRLTLPGRLGTAALLGRGDGRSWDITALVLAVAAWTFNPYHFAVSDHTYKIPFLKASWDPSLYTRDLTVGMRVAYASLFSWVVGPFNSIVGLDLAFFIIQSVTILAFFLLVARLGTLLTGERLVGWFAILLLFFPQVVAGGISTFDLLVQERFVAFVFVLASLLLLAQGRAVAAGLLAGFAGDVHLVTLANFLVAAACLFGITLARAGTRRAATSTAGRFLLAMFVGALPVLTQVVRNGQGRFLTWIDPEWLRMIVVRSPQHFLPDYRLFGAHALLGLVLIVLTWRWQADRRLRDVLAAAMLGMIAGFVLATLFVTTLPWLVGLQLCLYRTDQSFLIVAAVATAWLFTRMFPTRPALALVALVLFSFAPWWTRLGLMCGLALISLAMPSRQNRIDTDRWPLRGRQMIVGLALFLLIAIMRGHRPHWDNPLQPKDSPNIEAQRWLRLHTERNALVLTPPGESDFRIFSERSVLGSWKDWTYNVLSRDFAFEMYDRLHEMCGLSPTDCSSWKDCEQDCDEHYAHLSESDILRLARKYGLNYVVRPAGAPLAWPSIFKNSGYLVYAIPQSDRRPQPSSHITRERRNLDHRDQTLFYLNQPSSGGRAPQAGNQEPVEPHAEDELRRDRRAGRVARRQDDLLVRS